jgi:hypothetical protein
MAYLDLVITCRPIPRDPKIDHTRAARPPAPTASLSLSAPLRASRNPRSIQHEGDTRQALRSLSSQHLEEKAPFAASDVLGAQLRCLGALSVHGGKPPSNDTDVMEDQ